MTNKTGVLVLFCLCVFSASTQARTVSGITDGLSGAQNFIQFDDSTPSSLFYNAPITLSTSAERLVGIDVRPATGVIYGVSNTSNIYTIAGGVATYVRALPDTCQVDNGAWVVDFNPQADAMRLLSSTRNYRLPGATGFATCVVDGAIPSTPDSINVISGAYDRNFRGTNATSLFNNAAISLAQITSPNAGTFGNNVALSVTSPNTATAALDSYFYYDAVSTNSANVLLAALQVGGVTTLYVVDTTTGSATSRGTLGTGTTSIISITASLHVPFPFGIYGIQDNNLISFSISNPTAITTATINGAADQDFIAISLRPATYHLYAITASSSLYIIYPYTNTNVSAFLIGTLTCTLSTAADVVYSVDFNPAADRLRIVSSTGENYRVNVDDASCIVDGNLFDTAGGATPIASGVAYTNGYRSASPATLGTAEYIINTQGGNFLARVVAPNIGNTTNIGGLTNVDADTHTPFGIQYGYIAAGGIINEVNLATGVATFVASFSDNIDTHLQGIAVLPDDYTLPLTPIPTPATSAPTILPVVLPTNFSVNILSGNTIIAFNIGTPSSSVSRNVNVPAGETLALLALRPASYVIYAISRNNNVYALNPRATSIDAVLTGTLTCPLAFNANSYSADFNPVADRLRIVSSSGENYRVNVDDASCITDGNLFYPAGSSPAIPSAVGVAYTNGFRSDNPAALGTAEFIIDSNSATTGALFSQVVVPNVGNTTRVGALGGALATVPSSVPMDILTVNGVQYAFIVSANILYSINIATGGATQVLAQVPGLSTSQVATGLIVLPTDYAVPTASSIPTNFGVGVLYTATTFKWFNVQNPSSVTELPISVPAGVTLLTAALRPSTYQIYAISDTSDLFILYPFSTNVTAYLVGRLTCTIAASTTNHYSSDFNPAADRLRVVSTSGQNYRINVDTAACTTDGNLFNVADGTTPTAAGVAYTNGFRNADPATLGTVEYIIDTTGSRLSRVIAPNFGNTSAVGALSFTATSPSPLGITLKSFASARAKHASNTTNNLFLFDRKKDILTFNSTQYGYTASATTLNFVDLNDGSSVVVATYVAATQTQSQPLGLVVFPTDYSVPAFPVITTTTTSTTNAAATTAGATTDSAATSGASDSTTATTGGSTTTTATTAGTSAASAHTMSVVMVGMCAVVMTMML